MKITFEEVVSKTSGHKIRLKTSTCPKLVMLTLGWLGVPKMPFGRVGAFHMIFYGESNESVEIHGKKIFARSHRVNLN